MKKQEYNLKKLCFAGILVAIGVVCSAFAIPVGASKCLPVQHMVNVIAGITLGPVYAVLMAFVTSTIRILLGTGSLLAYPGSMCGALLCGLLYRFTKKPICGYIGEIIGTGIIGAILSYPIGTLILGKEMALFGMVIPFSISTIGGTIIAGVLLTALFKTHILQEIKE